MVEIALLQSNFMVVAMLTEFPSGVVADVFSRKIIYLLSLITLFISYLLIGFFSGKFEFFVVAYILYGLSVSLKSGTLEAEVVLECDKKGIDIKYYSVATSYVMSISAIIGGFLGSIFYEHIQQFIYFIALFLFVISFIMALLCSFKGLPRRADIGQSGSTTLIGELKNGFHILRTSKSLLYLLVLFAVSTLFLQPFFQYWQVLYQENDIPVRYFGVLYVTFQICNLLGAIIYKKLKVNKVYIIFLLCLVPLIFAISLFYEKAVLILLPISVMFFYVYYQHLDVIQKNEAPKQYMSSFFSLVGTIENVASVISLFVMAICIEHLGTQKAYVIVFSFFAFVSIIVYTRLEYERRLKD